MKHFIGLQLTRAHNARVQVMYLNLKVGVSQCIIIYDINIRIWYQTRNKYQCVQGSMYSNYKHVCLVLVGTYRVVVN